MKGIINLQQLAKEMPIIDALKQAAFIGGCTENHGNGYVDENGNYYYNTFDQTYNNSSYWENGYGTGGYYNVSSYYVNLWLNDYNIPYILQGIFEHAYITPPDFSNYNFCYGGWKAGATVDNTIMLGSSFFYGEDFTDADKCSIVMHELYHVDNFHTSYQQGTTEINLDGYQLSDIPENVLSYFEHINIPQDEIYSYMTNYGHAQFSDPQRYRNEIAAYEYELELGYNISESYRKEIEARIWQYREYIKMIEYSNNQSE